MTETKTQPTQDQIEQLTLEFLADSDREKRLYDLLENLPSKRILVGHNGGVILIEQDFTRGRVRTTRDVTVIGGSAFH